MTLFIFRENPRQGFSEAYIKTLLSKPSLFERGFPPLFWPSGAYSLGKCLRVAARWPCILPIPVYHDHGVCLLGHLEKHELESSALTHLTWCLERYQRLHESSTSKAIVRVTHPYILWKRAKGIPALQERTGTIIFFPHSTGENDLIFNRDQWLLSVMADKRLSDPRVICMHPIDLNKGYHRSLLRMGCRVVTAGNIYHHLFVDRFYALISRFRNSVHSTVGSDLFLCWEQGLNACYIDANITALAKTSKTFSTSIRSEPTITSLQHYITMLFSPDTSIKDKDLGKTKIATEVLGDDCYDSSLVLRKILHRDFILLIPFILKKYATRCTDIMLSQFKFL